MRTRILTYVPKNKARQFREMIQRKSGKGDRRLPGKADLIWVCLGVELLIASALVIAATNGI